MKGIHELICLDDPGWSRVQQWVGEASNPVDVLPPKDDRARELALLDMQVTTRSAMGAIVYETGGIFVDHGWLRILGSGHPRLPRSLPAWNAARVPSSPGGPPPFLLVADDVLGGFFAIDGGGLRLQPGKVCYFAPDTLSWECMGLGYSEFIVWCFSGDLEKYYLDVRWPGWQDEVAAVPGDRALSVYPFLFSAGPVIADRSRRSVPVNEIYQLHVAAG